MDLLHVAASVAFVVAGVLAWHGKDGWGWFLFAGILAVAK